MYHGFNKNIGQHSAVFNIENNHKCFLSRYYYDFWRSCDTDDWSNDAESTALITDINYILTDIHIETVKINIKLNCNNILLYFWSNKYILGEQKKLPEKIWFIAIKSSSISFLLFYH